MSWETKERFGGALAGRVAVGAFVADDQLFYGGADSKVTGEADVVGEGGQCGEVEVAAGDQVVVPVMPLGGNRLKV